MGFMIRAADLLDLEGFDILQPVRRSFLTDRVGSLGAAQSGEICRALAALADC